MCTIITNKQINHSFFKSWSNIMCGILAWFSQHNEIDEKRALRALALLNHRGPDYHNLFKDSQKKYIMGHTRLSIIDLHERSHQPFITDDGQHILIFNGEIYNYLELKQELIKCGHHFKSESDTEVLAYALKEWSSDAFKKMNGMWSLAFLDIQNKTLLISRDRFGKKPLYYYYDEEQFLLASEPKAIFSITKNKRVINENHMLHFIKNNMWLTDPQGTTMFKGISQLSQGEHAIYELNSHFFKKFKNDFFDFSENQNLSLQSLKKDLKSSINIRLRADVPVAVLLSGGVDSSIIAAYAAQNTSHSLKFYMGSTGYGKDDYFAKSMAKNLDIELVEVNLQDKPDIIHHLKKLTLQYELPVMLLGNSVAVAYMYQAMARDGIRVVLDGTGGDEIFGGYFDIYTPGYLKEMAQNREIIESIKYLYYAGKYKQYPYGKSAGYFVKYFLGKTIYQFLKQLKHVFKKPFQYETRYYNKHTISTENEEVFPLFDRETDLNLKELQIFDIKYGRFPNWLLQNDQNSMMHSIESRSPLLDYRLFKYINLPGSLKFHNGFNKYQLRRAMPYPTPDEVRWRRDKQGFRWVSNALRSKNKKEFIDVIANSKILKQYVNTDSVLKDLINNEAGAINFSLKLFPIALFEDVYSCEI